MKASRYRWIMQWIFHTFAEMSKQTDNKKSRRCANYLKSSTLNWWKLSVHFVYFIKVMTWFRYFQLQPDNPQTPANLCTSTKQRQQKPKKKLWKWFFVGSIALHHARNILVSSCWHRLLTLCHSTVPKNNVQAGHTKKKPTLTFSISAVAKTRRRKRNSNWLRICICHLNHPQNSSTFKLFRKCSNLKTKILSY